MIFFFNNLIVDRGKTEFLIFSLETSKCVNWTTRILPHDYVYYKIITLICIISSFQPFKRFMINT